MQGDRLSWQQEVCIYREEAGYFVPRVDLGKDSDLFSSLSPGGMQDAMLIPTPPRVLEPLTPSVSLNQQHILALETMHTW